jgi:hypothetical protein
MDLLRFIRSVDKGLEDLNQVVRVLIQRTERAEKERDSYKAALDTIVNGECYSLDAAQEIAGIALDLEV